jgi:membrane-bound ClpP family serine protease
VHSLLFVLIALFSKGQKIFALAFIVLFIIGMIWAYRSDAKVNKLYYKNVWLVLVSMIIILASIVVLVKILH